ncbi:polysaccharide deacetylase family protein [Anaeromyxobacter dehalogenans]|uniref:Polysaccharide deacetylase n=1 Tax=Anaeromyxobacter dehalogenans (strain 2CP-C) TaxID=290397 RepID=Q2IL81_ANADE|nr:polysaccharide deacetylase family protein [Anaeromyxobacter dehalogenans]ABC82412.1 Polysaccharide deacetylase [Anaeromyxobacter dehalogenans 2CP-C]
MPERADGSPRWIVRRALKVAVARALHAAGAHRAVGTLRRRQAGGARVLVVSYHRVTHDYRASAREGLASLLVSADTLRRQLEQLGRTRELVSLADARRILAEPPGTARARDVVTVTFDDGYADVHGVALPILRALGAPATAFVVTGLVGTSRRLPHDRIYAALAELATRGIPPERAGLPRGPQALLDACARAGPAATLDRLIARLPHPRLLEVADALAARVGLADADLPAGTRVLDWDEIRALQAGGVEVGGHTVTHAVLPHLPAARARREIAGCRDALAERLGRPPRAFAYPNGYHTPAVRRLVAELGFEVAVTTEDAENVRGGDPLALRRKMVWENTTLGPAGYSPALATCNLEGVFTALGLVRPVPGEWRALADAEEERARPSGRSRGARIAAG